MLLPPPTILHQKFVILANAKTSVALELYFNQSLPGFHINQFEEAHKKWSEKGIEVICHGGGKVAIIGEYAVFYSKSERYHKFIDEEAEPLAKIHPMVVKDNLTVICKAGSENPWELILEHYEKNNTP